MIRQWGHGHSLAVGVVGGLLLDRHVLYVFFLGAIIGGLVVYSSRTIRSLGRAAGTRAAELHQATVDRLHAQAVELHSKAENRKRTRAEQDAAVKKAYIDGAIDAKQP